jgi:hypothetical protein
MQKLFSLVRTNFTSDKYPYLTIISNIFFGLGVGRIIALPADELSDNLPVKILLIVGTCLFFNYITWLRKASKGVRRTTSGRFRPLLREAMLCAALNAFVLLSSLSLFFLKAASL